MERGEPSSGKKLERKTVEKQRRILMKSLCFKMASLIPGHYFPLPKEFLSQLDQLEYATAYIENLRARLEELKRRKEELMNSCRNNRAVEPEQTTLSVKELGPGVEVVVVSGLVTMNFRLQDVISIIEEEAAEVLTVSVSKLDDKTIHTIHAQVKIARVGVDIARISARIHELISS